MAVLHNQLRTDPEQVIKITSLAAEMCLSWWDPEEKIHSYKALSFLWNILLNLWRPHISTPDFRLQFGNSPQPSVNFHVFFFFLASDTVHGIYDFSSNGTKVVGSAFCVSYVEQRVLLSTFTSFIFSFRPPSRSKGTHLFLIWKPQLSLPLFGWM